MIRIRGFARKTRRPTKGGSLPDPDREVYARNGGHNGVNNGNGNGTDAIHRNGSDHRTVNARDSSADTAAGRPEKNGDLLSHYLHDVVEQLIEPTAPIEGRAPLDNLAVDGKVPPQLEPMFAQVAISIGAAKRSPSWKRVFDIICIVATLPIWLPLLLVVP